MCKFLYIAGEGVENVLDDILQGHTNEDELNTVETDTIEVSPAPADASKFRPNFSFLSLNPLSAKKKMHQKMSSAEVVCCKLLPSIRRIKYRSKQRRPRTDCSYRSSLIWVHTVCHRGFLIISADKKTDNFCCDWRFKG